MKERQEQLLRIFKIFHIIVQVYVPTKNDLKWWDIIRSLNFGEESQLQKKKYRAKSKIFAL